MRAAARSEGFRFRSGPDVDLDAYPLEDGTHALFAHVKAARAAGDDAVTTWVDEFGGEVSVVGRAWKTPSASHPLAPVWLLPGGEPAGALAPRELWAVEGPLRLRLEVENVLNPGLFLDQRENRRRLTERVRALAKGTPSSSDRDSEPSRGLRALNLFSYTGAFSLAALQGGAVATTSVDTTARYLAWEGKNLARNFPALAPSCRLLRDDAPSFLRRATKRGDRYAFIVIDPPTFSRGRRPFRARDDLAPLVKEALRCLTPERGAAVFASTNDAGWPATAFADDLARIAEGASLRFEPGVIPDDFGQEHALRSAWLFRE